MALRTRDFHYELPEERAASRMMVVHRESGKIEHRMFCDFPDYLSADDFLMLNDTKVIPARVFSDDGKIELLCLDRLSPLEWRCLVKPGKKMRVGKAVTVGGTTGNVVKVFDNGDRLIRWEASVDLDQHGHLALPHYMGRDDEMTDRERYQTVFAREESAFHAGDVRKNQPRLPDTTCRRRHFSSGASGHPRGARDAFGALRTQQRYVAADQ
jgi:S-adenosylmethionine:tRNA ribosyltransferase-isomerase